MGFVLELLLSLIVDFVLLSLPFRVWLGCMGVMVLGLIALFGWIWYVS